MNNEPLFREPGSLLLSNMINIFTMKLSGLNDFHSHHLAMPTLTSEGRWYGSLCQAVENQRNVVNLNSSIALVVTHHLND